MRPLTTSRKKSVQKPDIIGKLRIGPHDDREDERRAEHRHHVLAAQPDGSSPAEPLAGSDHFTRSDVLSISVQRPNRHDGTFRAEEGVRTLSVLQLTKHRDWSETLLQRGGIDVMTICQNPRTRIGNISD